MSDERLEQLERELAELRRRVQVVEDIAEIRRLKARYAALCDANYDADALAELFTEDATWEGSGMGSHQGPAAIRQFFREGVKTISFALHYVLNDQVEVDPSGETATATWYLWQPATMDGQAVWISGRYEDRYRKVDGRWLFSHVKVKFPFITPFEKGWVQQRFR